MKRHHCHAVLWASVFGQERERSTIRETLQDLQTNETYVFNVCNWLGTQNGDGQTERLVPVMTKKEMKTLDEAMRIHNVADHLSWMNMYTGKRDL